MNAGLTSLGIKFILGLARWEFDPAQPRKRKVGSLMDHTAMLSIPIARGKGEETVRNLLERAGLLPVGSNQEMSGLLIFPKFAGAMMVHQGDNMVTLMISGSKEEAVFDLKHQLKALEASTASLVSS